MSRRKLIEFKQENIVVCDHVNCSYVVPNPTGDPNIQIDSFLNKPCPYCGSNLLTQEDLDQYLKMMRAINWINKWFSWLTIFKSKKNKTHDSFSFKVHEGVKIKKEPLK